MSHSTLSNLVFLLLLRRFVVWNKASENYNFFPEHYIPLLFHRPTASSTTPLHTTRARYISACQRADIFRVHDYLPTELKYVYVRGYVRLTAMVSGISWIYRVVIVQ